MVYVIGIVLMYLCKLSCGRIQAIKEKGDAFSRKAVIAASFTILFLISALRDYRVGIDTLNYVRKFDLIQKYSFAEILSHLYSERVEFGYAFINRLCGLISDDPRIIVIVNSAIICYGMANYIYRFTDFELDGVILFTCCGLFLHSLNITRQIMACVMMMNAWGALTHKKYGQSAIWFFAGTSLHITSLIFAVTYFFYFFRNSKKVILVSFASSLGLAALFKPILHIASLFIDSFRYFDNADDKISAGGIWAIWAIELLIAAFFVLSYLKNDGIESKANCNERLLHTEDMICVPIFVVYYIIFTFMGTQFNYLDRFGVYFLPFILSLFLNYGKIVKARDVKCYKIYHIGLMLGFLGYFILSIRADQYQYAFGW